MSDIEHPRPDLLLRPSTMQAAPRRMLQGGAGMAAALAAFARRGLA